MSFAKKLARKQKKSIRIGTKKGEREVRRSQQMVRETYAQQYRRELQMRKNTIRNLSACFLLATNERYKFGRGKLLRLKEKMQSEFDAIMAGNVSIYEIADFLRDEMKMNLGLYNDPKADTQRQIELQAVKEMSCAFFMALIDEFNFGKKRLNDAYEQAADLSDRVKYGKISYDEIRAKVEKIFARGRKIE